jgi:hypothetical protein
MKKNNLYSTFAFALILSMAATLIILPNVNAHTPPWQIQLFANINVAPNPAGIGQSVTVNFWLNAPPMTANGPYGDRYGPFTVNVIKPDGTNQTLGPFFSDATGGTATHYTPDVVGEYQFQMTFPGMNMTGSTNNPGGGGALISNPTYVNDTILPATSPVATLTVQQESVPLIPSTPLPSEYWQAPINAMNVQNWYAIGGPYLSLYTSYGPGKGGSNYNTTTNFNPYSEAPLTPHIIWTRPAAPGGVIGGDAGGTTTYGNYYSTSQYERKYQPIVINGIMYYTQFPGASTNPVGTYAVDLYTGKTLWVDDSSNYGGGDPQHNMLTTSGIVTPLYSGQVLDYVSPNQYGGIAYLWTQGTPSWLQGNPAYNPRGTTLNMFDAMTGKYILSIVNGTGFSYGHTVDASGNFIDYYVNGTVGTQTIYGAIQPITGPAPTRVTNTAGNSLLEVWNSTQCIMMGAGWATGSASGWFWRPPQSGVIPYEYGIQNAWQLPGTVPYSNQTYTLPNPTYPNTWTIYGVNSGVAVLYSAANQGLTAYFQSGYEVFTGFDVTGTNSAVNSTYNPPLFIQNQTFTPFTAVNLDNYGNIGNGVYTTVIKETGLVQAFDVHTGKEVWRTTLTGDNNAAINPYDALGGIKGNIYGNSFLLFGFGGDVWSLDMATGGVNWYTNTTKLTGDAGSNTPYGIWPIWVQTGIGGGGGVMWLEEGHEYSPPLFLGAELLALNTTTGELIWSIHSFDVDANPELAYGIMTILNAYDNQIYAYGKGPTRTLVNAAAAGISTSSPVTITGTVMDVSAGASQEAVAKSFPNGLPAVSDDSIRGLMEAVYMQQPIPHNLTGVPVTLSVIDANNNFRTIGTTTTDGTGAFGYTWTPDISGTFTVIASFTGSNGYYGSSAQTYFYAGEAATPQPTAGPGGNAATTGDLLLYVGVGVIAIIIAIAIVGALILRRR